MSFCENNDLQLLCLKCISFNFERFFILFNSNVEENLLSCIKVIRKCYCDQLLRMLSENGTLKSEHLQFVINKYTREIDLQYLKNCSFCAIEERLEAVGSVLTKLSMSGVRNFPDRDNFLLYLQNIQVLQLSDSSCTDRSVDILSDNCSQLKSLDLSGCSKVTDAGLTILCKKSPPLEYLNVEYTSVTYKSVALALTNIPTLTKLRFDHVPAAISEVVDLKDFSKIKTDLSFNLKNLVLFSSSEKPAIHLTNILKGCIKMCPTITDLIVSEIQTEKQLELCSQFKNVNSLRLQLSENITPQLCINNFLELRGDKLTSLLLTSFSLSVEVLAKCCPNLEELILRKPAFQQMTHSDINFPRLKTLSLHYVQSNQRHVSGILSSTPHLEELNILFCTCSEEMKDAVLHCSKRLKTLSFSDTVVSTQFIQDILEEHTNLSTLTLRHTGISITDFTDLMAVADEKKNKVRIVYRDEPNGDVYDVVHNSYKRYRIMIRMRRA